MIDFNTTALSGFWIISFIPANLHYFLVSLSEKAVRATIVQISLCVVELFSFYSLLIFFEDSIPSMTGIPISIKN